jgi:hypothetical protein
MGLKLLMNLEKHVFYAIILSIVGILWYVSFWGIIDESVEYINQTYEISKRAIYISIISVILIFILMNPGILDTLNL